MHSASTTQTSRDSRHLWNQTGRERLRPAWTPKRVSRNRLQRRGVHDCCTKMEENWCLCEYQEPTTLPEGIIIPREHSSAHYQVCGGQASQLGSTCQHDFTLWTCIQGSGFEKDEWKVLVFVNTGRNTRSILVHFSENNK